MMSLFADYPSDRVAARRPIVACVRVFLSASSLAVAGFGIRAASAAPGDSFSFALIADPHICTETPLDPNERLRACVDWINRNRQQEGIELTFVLGDIGYVDDGRSIQSARNILDGLQVPYAPIQGDNDGVTPTDEQRFAATFEPVYQSLAANPRITNWQKAPGPVYNANIGAQLYFQNYAFDYRGVHFACLDWCDRGTKTNPVRKEDADLHDFTGGTWPWFTNYISTCAHDKQEDLVMLSHHPMHTMRGDLAFLSTYGGFAAPEFARINAFLGDPNHDYASHIAANFAGHYHFEAFLPADLDPNRINAGGLPIDPNYQNPDVFAPLPGYDLQVVPASYLEPPQISLVRVTEGDIGFTYETTTVVVPEPSVLAFALLAEAVRRGPRGVRRRRPAT